MSTRERWIIYPLLFLSFGLALRDKVIPPRRFDAQTIYAQRIRCDRLESSQAECRQMTVAQAPGTAGIRLGTIGRQGGRIEVFDAGGRHVLEAGAETGDRSGMLRLFGADGKLGILLRVNRFGGFVSTIMSDNEIFVFPGENRAKPRLLDAILNTGRNLFVPLPAAATPTPPE